MSGEERLDDPVIVRVFAAPAGPNACGNTWEAAARSMEEWTRRRYGGRVRFVFVPLFSAEFFSHPDIVRGLQDGSAQPPIVTVADRIIQAGGKLSERLIRQALEDHGLAATGPEWGKR